MDLQTLVDRSPFAPPAGSVAETSTEQPGTLEFRGMAVDQQGTSYSVFDATANKGFWLREGGDGPLRIKSYNAQDAQLEVEQNGRPVKLQMKRATIQAGAAIALPQQPQPGTQAGGGQVRRSGDPASDTRRLEAVASEVRRRRALRNAAANQAVIPPPAPVPSTP